MLAIINAKIYTVTNGVIEQGSILLADGKIVALGAAIDIPAEAHVIDAKGAIVTPGLIDAHTHVGGWEEGLGWEGADINESTNPVVPHVNILDGINPADVGFADARKGGVTTVQTMPGSANIIGGLMLAMKTSGTIVDKMVLKYPTGMKAALGENPKNNYGSKGKAPTTRMGAAALLREALLSAQQYVAKQERGDKDWKFDPKMENMAKVIRKEIPLRIHAHRADDILTAIRVAKEFDIDFTIEHCTEGHLIAEEIVKHHIPVCVGPTVWRRAKVETKNISPTTAGVIARAGGKVAIITDHNIVPQHYFRIAVGLCIREGLPEEEALKAVTINPAEIIGVADRVGSLEVGKDADLAMWSGDPFEPLTHCLLTVIDGEIVYEREEGK
ncbi:MAG: amidohydrolase [Firmicutes bacterium]|nr:amidohydrolase [Bacillota bacterium]